jgi:hypothetical protein
LYSKFPGIPTRAARLAGAAHVVQLAQGDPKRSHGILVGKAYERQSLFGRVALQLTRRRCCIELVECVLAAIE